MPRQLSWLSRTTVAIACGMAIGMAPLIAQEPIAWKFVEGKAFRYEMVQRTRVDVDAGDAGSFTTIAEQTTEVLWSIGKVNEEGSAEGLLTIEKIQVAMSMPDGLEMVYDSQSDERPAGVAAMLSPLYAALLDAKIPMTVSKRGELLRFEPSEETLQRLTGVPATRAMSDLVAGAGLRQMAEQITFSRLPQPREIENRVLGTIRGELLWNRKEPSTKDDTSGDRFEPQMALTIEPAPSPTDDSLFGSKPLTSPKIEKQSVDGKAFFDIEGHLDRSTFHIVLEISGQVAGVSVTSKMDQTVDIQQLK